MKTTLFLGLCSIAFAAEHETTHGRPNVVLFVMDDQPYVAEWEESAPDGNFLEGTTVTLDPYPMPRIAEFRDEAVIFQKSYCGAPKCAPSRMCLLTGRQAVSCDYAIEETLKERGSLGSGIYGAGVTVQTMKMQGYDAEHNLPSLLRDNGYYTGMVGKWHLMTNDDNGLNLDCQALEMFPNADLYAQCKDILSGQGFDFVEAWYWGNIKTNDYFGHNPEWMVNEAQKFFVEATARDEPFFLYFASTLVHSPDPKAHLVKFPTAEDTPKGKLFGTDDPTGKTTMWDRTEIWEYAEQQAQELGLNENKFAAYWWMDQQFGALVDALKFAGVYDDTLVVVQQDHGQIAKGMLYEQGTRILNFQRYPPKFGKEGPMLLPHDFVTSNVDIAPAVFHLAGITPPAEYHVDGVSYIEDVAKALADPTFDQVADGDHSCQYKFLDIKNSHSMVSGDYQYIFRATDAVESMMKVDDLYANSHDAEQLYDLQLDPNQKVNILNDAPRSMANSELISEFQTIMREYLDIHCIAETGAQCSKPELSFGPSSGGYFVGFSTTEEGPTEPTGDPATTAAGADEPPTGDPVTTVGGPITTKPLTGDPITTKPATTEFKCPTQCCSTDDCRGSQVCSENGECERPSSGSSSGGTDSGCSSDDDCRGSQVCTDGACGRPTSSGGSSGSSSSGCSSDADCRGSQICQSGECGRASSSGGSSSSKTCSSDGDCRGSQTCHNGVCARWMEQEMALGGGIETESASWYSLEALQKMTVSVSTVLMLFAAAIALWAGRWCLGKVYVPKERKQEMAFYGSL